MSGLTPPVRPLPGGTEGALVRAGLLVDWSRHAALL